MLRVGLTGDLGSGKSTVAHMLAERGAIVFSSDEMGRELMQPGNPVFDSIVTAFGPEVRAVNGTLNRNKLAALAFDPKHPRVEELNAIVHPAVIEAQTRAIEKLRGISPHAIVVVESALIFSTTHGGETHSAKGTWRDRFDHILLVDAPEEAKIARFVDRMARGQKLSAKERSTLAADAQHRLALQHQTSPGADCLVLHNDGDIKQLEHQVQAAWLKLQHLERSNSASH